MISFDNHTIVSILITVFLALIIINHFFKDLLKLIPFYRNNILLEGFDVVADPSGNAAAAPVAPAKDDIMKMLKDLGELKAAGILTEEEFAAKKTELLAKL